jgi:hypothetical protein
VRHEDPQNGVLTGLRPGGLTIAQDEVDRANQALLLDGLEVFDEAGAAAALDLDTAPVSTVVAVVALVTVVELDQGDLEALAHGLQLREELLQALVIDRARRVHTHRQGDAGVVRLALGAEDGVAAVDPGPGAPLATDLTADILAEHILPVDHGVGELGDLTLQVTRGVTGPDTSLVAHVTDDLPSLVLGDRGTSPHVVVIDQVTLDRDRLAVGAGSQGLGARAVTMAVLTTLAALSLPLALARLLATLSLPLLPLALAVVGAALGAVDDHFGLLQASVDVLGGDVLLVVVRHGDVLAGEVLDAGVVLLAVDHHVGGNVEQLGLPGAGADAVEAHDVFDLVLDDAHELLDGQPLTPLGVEVAVDVAAVYDADTHGADRLVGLPAEHGGHRAIPGLHGEEPAPRLHESLTQVELIVVHDFLLFLLKYPLMVHNDAPHEQRDPRN